MSTRTIAALAFVWLLLTAPLVSRELEPNGSFDIVGTAITKVNGQASATSFIGWLDYDVDTRECVLYLEDLAFDGTLTPKGKSGEWAAEFKSGFKLAYEDENDGDVVKVARYRITKLVMQDGIASGRISARYRVVGFDGTKQTVAIEGSFAGTDAFGF